VRDDARSVALRRRAASAVAFAALLAAPAARAGEPVRLHWVRLEGAGACVDPATIEARVRERLGSDPFDVRATRTIEGVARRAGESWSALIAVRARPGEAEPPVRELKSQAKDCDVLGEAVVLAVALAIDPAAAFAPAPKPAPPSAPPSVTAVAPPPAPAGRAGRAELGLVGQAGLLPRASFGASLLASAAVSAHFELAARAELFPAVEVAGDPSYALGLALGDVRVCARRPARVEVRACGGPAAGVVSAAVLAGDRAQPGERAWVAGELGLDAAVALGRSWAIRAGLEGVVPITRYRFTVEGSDVALFRQSAVAGVANVGVELRFGGPR
jgi:hypothetical protein